MKEIKKIAHNEILCQEILTESSSSLKYQDFKNLAVETSYADSPSLKTTSGNTSSMVSTISTAVPTIGGNASSSTNASSTNTSSASSASSTVDDNNSSILATINAISDNISSLITTI